MKNRSIFWKAIISAAFFAVLFRVIRAHDFLAMFRQINVGFFIASVLMPPLMIGASCLKWQVLLRHQGFRIPFFFLLRNYLIGYYFTNLLPSNVGGDVVRSYNVGRHVQSQSRVAASVFFERFTGMILLLTLVIVVPFFGSGLYHKLEFIVPAVLAACLLAVFVLLASIRRPVARLQSLADAITGGMLKAARRTGLHRTERLLLRLTGLADRILGAGASFYEKVVHATRVLKVNPVELVNVVWLSILFYALTWVNVYLSFRAFNVHPAFRDVATVLPTALMVAMVPVPTLGNLGLAEGSYVFFFHLVGIAPASTLMMGLFLRFKLILVGLAGYVSYVTYRHEKYVYGQPPLGEAAPTLERSVPDERT